MSNEGDDKRGAPGQGNGQPRNQAGDGPARGEGDDASEGKRAAAPQAAPIDRLAALEAERDEIKDRMLRIAAEFENWKKRARKEQEEAEAKSREAVLRDMLDVMDNLERALGASGKGDIKPADKPRKVGAGGADGRDKAGGPGAGGGEGVRDAQAVLKGVELVMRLFQSKLERYGIKPIVTAGQPFDPHVHEAISRIETSDVPAGHVAVEMQRGYRTGDRLLRPSLVGVAVTPGGATGAGGGPGGGGPGGGGTRGSSNDLESGNGFEKDGA